MICECNHHCRREDASDCRFRQLVESLNVGAKDGESFFGDGMEYGTEYGVMIQKGEGAQMRRHGVRIEVAGIMPGEKELLDELRRGVN